MYFSLSFLASWRNHFTIRDVKTDRNLVINAPCCSSSRDKLRGKSSESTTPKEKEFQNQQNPKKKGERGDKTNKIQKKKERGDKTNKIQ
ncbi:hypothetical protein AYI68_g6742, partial [Smittium mucronatum]